MSGILFLLFVDKLVNTSFIFTPNWYQNNHQKPSNPADPITISKFLI